MQSYNQSSKLSLQDQSIREIATTLLLGLMIGLLVFGFFKALQWIEIQHQVLNEGPIPFHLIGLPIILFFLYEVKRRTLYFPTAVSEVTPLNIQMVHHWSPWMTFLHLMGNLLSHFVGASVGREGTAVMMSGGLVRLFKLSWQFWGPVALTIGFSAAMNQPWVSIVFMIELFSTNARQKIYAVIGSLTAVLLMKTLQVPHIFHDVVIQADPSFGQKLIFVLVAGASVGYTMRFYKWAYIKLSAYFKKSSIWIKLFVAVLLAFFLAQPALRKFQSLGLLQLENFENMSANLSDVIIKLFVTLISVTLGFWGGEFIPLIYAGLHFGHVVAHFLEFDLLLGTLLVGYLFFAGATRLKWTTLVLTLFVVGWGWWFWAYLLISTCVYFAGPISIYRHTELVD